MHKRFAKIIPDLDRSFRDLMAMRPVCVPSLPKDMPKAGIYLFTERREHQYVGRSRSLRRRLQTHCRPSSSHNSAVFAFLLAREATGRRKASYVPKGSRAALLRNRKFRRAFEDAKDRIRKMQVRFVEEACPLRQALLEIYAAVALKTPHNDFDTH